MRHVRENRNAYRVLMGKPEGNRPLERPEYRQKVNVKHSHYRSMGSRGFWKVKISRLKAIGCQPYAPVVFTLRSTLVLILRG
jgi:hypothetical protein